MSTEVIAALIGAGAAIIAALITAYVTISQQSRSTQSNIVGPTQAKKLDPKILKRLAINQTNQYISSQKQFSAWEVTLALRTAHQDAEIGHSEVREIVHAHMQAVINDGRYKRTTRQKGETSYILYVPVQ